MLLSTSIGCAQSDKPGVKHLRAEEFQKLLASAPHAQLVDVRTPQEFKSAKLKNALNISIERSGFQEHANALDKEKPLFVYCLTGARSRAAANYFHQAGFKNVYELRGGILAWKAANGAIETSRPASTGMTSEAYQQLLKSEPLVLMYFTAQWCAPCKRMAPMLDSLQREQRGNVKFVKIDADQNPEIMRQLNIAEIPTFVLYKNAAFAWKKVGRTAKSELIAAIQKHR